MNTNHARRACAAAFLAILSACNQTTENGIPCTDDEHCPTAYYCSAAKVCFERGGGETPASGPSAMEFVGVGRFPNDVPAMRVSISKKERIQSLSLTFHNAGLSEAAYPKITLSAADCLDLSAIGSNQIGIVRPNATVVVSTLVDLAAGCPSPVRVSVGIDIDSRHTEGSFDVLIE